MTATVHLLAGNSGPVNDGEKRVLDYLAKSLDEGVVLIPNITIPYPFPNTPEENDIIVVTDDAVFVVEVKDLAGTVEITEQEMVVNGDVRGNPYLSTRIKAQKLKSRIGDQLPWFRTMGWVEHIVVLARAPQSLSIVDSMKQRIVLIGSSTPLVNNNSPILHPKQIGRLVGHKDQIIQIITAGASNKTGQIIFGQFRGEQKLFEFPGGEAWRAVHVLSGITAVLEVFQQPPNINANQEKAWRTKVMELFSISQKIGPSADFDAPRDLIPLDNGSIVVVWPDRERNTLEHFLSESVDEKDVLDIQKARRLLVGYASAMQHLHFRGWTLGVTPPHNLLVRPNGRGAVVMGGSLPVYGSDRFLDLQFLGSVIAKVNDKAKDKVLGELAKDLSNNDPDKQPTVSFVLAVLEGAVEIPAEIQLNNVNLLERFTPIQELAKHKYGRTFRASDVQTGRNVTVKFEAGRPDGDWARREYRFLSSDIALNEPGIIGVVAGDSNDQGSYVATEFLDAPTIATLIDAGELADPKNALAVISDLLKVLQRIHPNIKEIHTILDSQSGALSDIQIEQIVELRGSGVAHNHLDPSNIRLVPNRGIVLSDCVRAAKFGEVIPSRQPLYWPPGQPMDVSDPLADLYGVGALIIRMLSHPSSIPSDDPIRSVLVDASLKAMNEDPNQRFSCAEDFLDVLHQTDAELPLPSPTLDVYQLQLEIENLIANRQFVDALAICPAEWEQTRDYILAKKQLVEVDGELLLEIEDVRLHYVGPTDIGPGLTGGNVSHDGGVAEVYIVTEPEGGVLEVRVCEAMTENGIARWVGVEQGLGVPDRLAHAVRSLRISLYETTDQIPWMEINQAQLKSAGNIVGQAASKLVDEEKLSHPLSPFTARELFSKFGASGFGTREELFEETNNRRRRLAISFGQNSEHLAAVGHFVTRIMPLYKGITET
jgi:serine/threonine protein kinase